MTTYKFTIYKFTITTENLDDITNIMKMLSDKAQITIEKATATITKAVPKRTKNEDPKKWTEEDIETFEDYDRFLIANGCKIAHAWDMEDWKQTDDCFIDEMLAEDYMNPYAEGEDEEATIYGLNYMKLHNQLRKYIENACVSN